MSDENHNEDGTAEPLTLDISLSVLDDLGANLYSSIPAVLSEAVANAWDADATEVRIAIDRAGPKITVEDNGLGMSRRDMQGKYLTIGYRRRDSQPDRTATLGRNVMGRKGIGKLSLFAIADTVEIVSQHEEAAPVGVRLHAPDIRACANRRESYLPDEIEIREPAARGTKITISDLRTNPGSLTESALRKRVARRFAVIGRDFSVWVDGDEITLDDRDDLPAIEYLWVVGEPDPDPRMLATKAKRIFPLPPLERDGVSAIEGWLGTFPDQKAVNPNEGDNQVAVLARGKVMHEDLLPSVKAAGYSARYLIGRIEADYLDDTGQPDIATSDRQSVKETDRRFEELLKWFQRSVKQVANDWNKERRDKSLQSAMDEFPAIKEWHGGLNSDAKRFASQLFGKIGSLNKADQETKCELYRNSIIAFERLRLRDHLTRIEELPDTADLSMLTALFRSIDEIEEVEYHNILRGRLSVVQKFRGLVEDDERERVLQEYLFDHLWLLDPSWERAAKSAYMERTVKTALDGITDSLSEVEKNARIDIGYRTHAGKHVIVELKRASTKTDVHALSDQLSKYRDAVAKVVRSAAGSDSTEPDVEVIAVLGREPGGNPSDPERQARMLRDAANARWITYDTLFLNTENAYREYMEAHERASRINDVIQQIRPSGQE